MRIMKIIMICLLIVGCKIKNDNQYFEEIYNISKANYSMIKVNYKELNEMVKTEEFDGVVFVLRADCVYCHDLLKMVNDKLNNLYLNSSTKIYIIESDKLDEEEKLVFAEEFSLTSVPSILFFENSKLKLTEISIPSDERLDELIKIIIEK